MIDQCVLRLFDCFPYGFVNHNAEFIAKMPENDFFSLKDCFSELDVQCKILEWFSRSAHKTKVSRYNAKNTAYHQYILNGINQYCGTAFIAADMETIYTYLGNRINHQLTVLFVKSGFDLNILCTDMK